MASKYGHQLKVVLSKRLMCVCVWRPVDVWAVGCLIIEMLTSQPLFPGESDLDQIHQIVRCFGEHLKKDCPAFSVLLFSEIVLVVGNLMTHHQELFHRNPVFSGVKLPECSGSVSLQQRFPTIPAAGINLAQVQLSTFAINY